MKYIVFIGLCFLARVSFGQDINYISILDHSILDFPTTENLQKLKKELLDQVIARDYGNTSEYSRNNNCVNATSGDMKGMYLSCIDVELYESSIGDFNQDGVKDIFLRIMDEGLGGGGNMFGYSMGVAQINEKGEVHFYEYFTAGKFSIAEYSFEGMDKNKLHLKVSTNYQSFINSKYSESDIYFYFKDGKIVSDHYNDCEMKEMVDKKIFKDELSDVKRESSFNEFFEETEEEQVQIGNARYSAVLSGCSGVNLSIQIQEKSATRFEHGDAAQKNYLLDKLDDLTKNTHFKSLINKLYTYLQQNGVPSDVSYLDDNWQFEIFCYTDNGAISTVISINHLDATESEAD